jgi:hypothetical protein
MHWFHKFIFGMKLYMFRTFPLSIIRSLFTVHSAMVYVIRTNNWIHLNNCVRNHFRFIAIPSLRLLYLIDEIHNPVIALKAVGHQWYWSYEYSYFTKLEFDSYIVQQEDQQINTFRLLDTDNWVVLPINSPIRIIVTAADILHSWTVPRLGVKTDAIPDRLNEVRLSINRPKINLWNQCI